MRLFVILVTVSAVIAIPLPLPDPQEAQPEGQPQEGQAREDPPQKPPSGVDTTVTWETMPVILPEPREPDRPASNPWRNRKSDDSNSFQEFDPAQFTGQVLNGAWDANAAALNTIGKYTGLAALGAGIGALGTGAANYLFPNGITVPQVPDAGAYNGY